MRKNHCKLCILMNSFVCSFRWRLLWNYLTKLKTAGQSEEKVESYTCIKETEQWKQLSVPFSKAFVLCGQIYHLHTCTRSILTQYLLLDVGLPVECRDVIYKCTVGLTLVLISAKWMHGGCLWIHIYAEQIIMTCKLI